jgi:hypothetical protein
VAHGKLKFGFLKNNHSMAPLLIWKYSITYTLKVHLH